MRQTRIRKRRPRPASGRQEPLQFDARDPDIVKAHQLARNPGSQGPPTAARVETTRILPALARRANIRPSGSSPGLTNQGGRCASRDVAGRITTVACTAVLGLSLVYHVMLIAMAQSGALSGRVDGIDQQKDH